MKQEKLEIIKKISITQDKTILECLKIMDVADSKLLFILDGARFISLISIGDIQRAILSNIPLSSVVSSIIRSDITIATTNDSIEFIKKRMLELRAESMPIINDAYELVDVYFWSDFFVKSERISNEKIDIPVVIMAGGQGTRLQPLTNVIPKPLIPITSKPIMEDIINNFYDIGCRRFYATINYRADMIEYYFNNIKKDYVLEYKKEDTFLGTAGSLFLLKNILNETFFVSNCDILILDDYTEFYRHHKYNNYDITIVVAIKEYSIPYGVIELDGKGIYDKIVEKPNYSFMVNTGMYILEPKVIAEIVENEFIHITTLVDICKSKNMKIGYFPISEGSWIDMGQWPEYYEAINQKRH